MNLPPPPVDGHEPQEPGLDAPELDVAEDAPTVVVPPLFPTTDPEPAPEPAAPVGVAVPPDLATYPGGISSLQNRRYELEEPIASGGAAVVWRAYDTVLNRTVAVKMLHPHLATDDVTVERFRRESLGAARVLHPNVVNIYDSGREADLAYLVMEYVDGPTLKAVLARRGSLAPRTVAALGEQVAAALGEAHRQGLVHRDVKPANILIGRDGVVKVTDFGIAKALSTAMGSLTGPGTVLGTAAYVAPEQLTRDKEGAADPRADIYALGLILHECLTGRPVFTGAGPVEVAQARLTEDVVAPRQLRADVPRLLDDLIVRATRREPNARPADGTAMAAALQSLVPDRPAELTARLVAGIPVGADIEPERELGRTSSLPVQTQVTPARSLGPGQIAALVFGSMILLAAGILGPRSLLGDEPGPQISAEGLLPIARAMDFDPYGQTSGTTEARENPEDVAAAHDGDLATGWATERYLRTSAFGNLKPGVGLWFDLGTPAGVGEIELLLAEPGVAIEVYASDTLPDPVDQLPGWGQRLVRVEGLDTAQVLALQPAVTARYWLIWVTNLAEVDGGFQAELREVRFKAT